MYSIKQIIETSVGILVFFLFAGCGEPKTKANKDVLNYDSSSAIKVISYDTGTNAFMKLYADWQKEQIRNKNYWANDSCNMQWFSRHADEDIKDIPYGFPDSSRTRISYADLNSDGIRDGLIAFTPIQCDGGNGAMWTQEQVFFLSGEKGYRITDSLRVEDFAVTGFDSTGFYWLDSIGTNKIYGMYFSFAPDDARCCPSTNKPVIFDYAQRKLVYIGENQQQN